MSENKKEEKTGVQKLREHYYEIKKQTRIQSEKLKEAFIKEKQKSDKKDERKIAKPRTPEADA